mmetsp:Transcript_71005/g.123161  ORF Transcript_71005/g.123161 Transcript_71005/m.123161 type:complete len:178 (-) Transcript_71005:48-581(-)
MSLITGGLGGLGLLCAREIGDAWGTPVYTTSRSGRMADTRPEMTQILDDLQQKAVHVACRCDMSDGSALMDLMAGLQRFPAVDMEAVNRNKRMETDPSIVIDEMIAEFRQKVASGYVLSPAERSNLAVVSTDLQDQLEQLNTQSTMEGYSKENHMARLAMEDRIDLISQLLGKELTK